MYRTLMEEANVRLCKDSSTVLTRVAAVKEACAGGVSILHGNHMEMLPAYLLGASGVCNAIASVIPDICLELYDLSVVKRQWDRARERFEEILPVFRFFQEHSLARCVKEASEMMGRPLGSQRKPLTGLSEPERQELAAILARYGYIE
jgi:dihydrodipicolinate synthase/N-acetylneuraminate lyase